MLIITCPYCGPRNESEFSYGGPVGPRRPDVPHEMSDADWVDYLTVPVNPMGPVEERWCHLRGCGLWMTHWRDTVSHDIVPDQSEPK